MLLSTNLSAGDFLDRLSILKIKREFGLDVNSEIKEYEKQLHLFESRGLTHFLKILLEINGAMWELEDAKRNSVKRKTDDYDNVSELITQINDIRYQVKKRIDLYFKSEITEEKSHKD
jgi:hypothetical protein